MVTVLAVVLAGAVPALGAKDNTPGLPVMVGLGDSWTYGQGASDPATGGYFGLTNDTLQDELDCLPATSDRARDGCKHLQVHNIARPAVAGLPGVTTDAVIAEQLPEILPVIAARNGDANPRNDVEIIYLSAGGNDVSGPVTEACIFGTPEQCEATITERMTHVAVNLHTIVGSLRAAAGPETPIVLVTYDSPIEYCFLGVFPGAVELGYFVLGQLDQVTRDVAATYGATVATTLGHLGAGDWVGGSDCLHPNDNGHMKVAEIAAAAIG
jgi:lysophospholipase L1-like esterase